MARRPYHRMHEAQLGGVQRYPRGAAGVRTRLRADVGLSVTGIAGPGGGTPEKPVGLVHLHAETPEESHGVEFSFPSDRETIRARARG